MPRSKLLTLEEAAASSRKTQGTRPSELLLLGEAAATSSDSGGPGECASLAFSVDSEADWLGSLVSRMMVLALLSWGEILLSSRLL